MRCQGGVWGCHSRYAEKTKWSLITFGGSDELVFNTFYLFFFFPDAFENNRRVHKMMVINPFSPTNIIEGRASYKGCRDSNPPRSKSHSAA